MKLNQLSVYGVSTTIAVALLMSACGSPKDRERGTVKMTATPTTAQGAAGKLSLNNQAAATNDIINKPIEMKETEKQLVMSIQALELNIDQSKNQYVLNGVVTGTPASIGGPKEFTATFDLTKVDASTGIIQTKDESHGLEFSLFVGNTTDKQKHVTIKSELLKSKIIVPIYVISDLSVTTMASAELDSKKVTSASDISAEKRAEAFAKALGATFVKKDSAQSAAQSNGTKEGKLSVAPKEETSSVTTQLTSEVIILKLADRNFISLKIQKLNEKKQPVSVIEAIAIENGVNGSKEALEKALKVQLKKSPISEDDKGIEANLIGNRIYEKNTDLKLDVSIAGLPGSSSNTRYSVTLLIKKDQPAVAAQANEEKKKENTPGEVSSSQDSKAAVTGTGSAPQQVVEENAAKPAVVVEQGTNAPVVAAPSTPAPQVTGAPQPKVGSELKSTPVVAPASKPATVTPPSKINPTTKTKTSANTVRIQKANGTVSSTDLV